MRVAGKFNDLSKSMLENLVTLKPGEFADYQLDSSFMVEVEDPETRKKTRWFPHQMFWAKATVWDQEKGETVDIGVIATGGIDPKTGLVTTVETFEFERGPSGVIRLTGSNPKDVELDQFLQLDNRCENGVLGEFRDASVQKMFRRVDHKKEAFKRNEDRKQKTEAMQLAQLMDHNELREFAASMNWDSRMEPEILAEQTAEYAELHYKDFHTKVEDQGRMKIRATIRWAIDDNKIRFDHAGYRFLWANGQTLASLERQSGKSELDVFADWLSTATNGPTIIQQLARAKTKKAPATA